MLGSSIEISNLPQRGNFQEKPAFLSQGRLASGRHCIAICESRSKKGESLGLSSDEPFVFSSGSKYKVDTRGLCLQNKQKQDQIYFDDLRFKKEEQLFHQEPLENKSDRCEYL